MLALSLTMKVYFPRLSDLTFLPWAFLSEIVNPGPMVPRSFGTAVVAPVAPVAMPAATSAAVHATASRRKPTSRLLPIEDFPIV
jgi:hypothetical protein